MKSFIMELGLKNVEPASCPHIIEPDQAKTYIVTKGPNIRLNFSYENRHNRDMYSELGLVLTEIIKNTKNGVVVFFPSYQLLEETVKHFNTSKVISKIYEHKTLHVESRENAQFTTTLESYLKAAQTPKGAVLFALIRGKISEGLDFADEKCRAVIIVGVPYPARKDIKVVAKIQYLNELGTKEKDVLNG
jgi:Rad3-related DNA helicase